jgi:hypothetical protein
MAGIGVVCNELIFESKVSCWSLFTIRAKPVVFKAGRFDNKCIIINYKWDAEALGGVKTVIISPKKINFFIV